MIKPQFAEDEIYHIYNRGVEKRKIFLDDADYLRFIHDLFEFNDEDNALNIKRRSNLNKNESDKKSLKPRKLLVEISVFTLMPNHFHLLVRQKKEKGIVKFMQKLGTGYSMYFNQKYERVGGLFQGRFKAVHIEDESHFIHLPFYIHSNPLKLTIDRGSTSITSAGAKKAAKFLENYRWSSYPDYIGKKNFPSVTSREFILDFAGGNKEYEKGMMEWLKEKDYDDVADLTLE